MAGRALPLADGETSEFDVLSAAGTLRNAGIDAGHAEAIAAVIGNAVKASRLDLVTKQDLREEIVALRHELKADIAAVRHELKEEIAALRQEMMAEIAALRQEMMAEIAALRQETMAEIAALRQETMAEIAATREEMRVETKESGRKMAEMENRLTLRLGAAMVAVNTLMFLALQVFG